MISINQHQYTTDTQLEMGKNSGKALRVGEGRAWQEGVLCVQNQILILIFIVYCV